MRSDEMRLELENWVERVMELKERSELIPMQEVMFEEYYLNQDICSILHEGLRREL